MGQMALGCLMRGQVVPDEVYARLVVAAVHRVRGKQRDGCGSSGACNRRGRQRSGRGGGAGAGEEALGSRMWDFPETAAQAALLGSLWLRWECP